MRPGDVANSSAEAAIKVPPLGNSLSADRCMAWPPQLGVRLPEGKWMNGLAPAKGAVMHGLDGGKTLRPHPRGNVTVERNALAKHLLMEARRLHPGIDFQFDAAIEVAFSLSVC